MGIIMIFLFMSYLKAGVFLYIVFRYDRFLVKGVEGLQVFGWGRGYLV